MAVTQEYSNIISIVTGRGLSGQYISYMAGEEKNIQAYILFAYDGPHMFSCDIQDGDSVNDFETNYKSSWNKPIEKRETETGLVQVKPRPVEATLALQFVYFTTGVADSLDHPEGENWEIDCSTPGQTIVTLKPTYPYYIDGGGLALLGNVPYDSVKVNFILAPGVGDVTIVKNKKLAMNNERFELEVPPKYVKYYPQLPAANWARIVVSHSEYDHILLEFYIRLYRN